MATANTTKFLFQPSNPLTLSTPCPYLMYRIDFCRYNDMGFTGEYDQVILRTPPCTINCLAFATTCRHPSRSWPSTPALPGLGKWLTYFLDPAKAWAQACQLLIHSQDSVPRGLPSGQPQVHISRQGGIRIVANPVGLELLVHISISCSQGNIVPVTDNKYIS